MKTLLVIIFLFWCGSSSVYSQITEEGTYFEPFKKDLIWVNKPELFEITNNKIIMDAEANSNWFASADGLFKINTAHRLEFAADSNFIFNAKVSTPLNQKWDGVALTVFADNEHWVKLCFEKDYQGNKRIVSVVTNGTSDDCNSDIIKGDNVYLQIAKKGDVIYLYYAKNKNEWYLVRNFRFLYTNIKLGLLVQSPIGKINRAIFSELYYSPNEIKDFWSGK